MKDDEIVTLGKNADAYANNQTSDSFDWKLIRDARFAQLVAAAEREACANFLQEQCRGVLSMQTKALIAARKAINSMKVEAETAAQGDAQMMLDACERISNEGLDASTAIDAAIAAAKENT